MKEPDSSLIFRHGITVPESAMDRNGHVNNVVYVQWMQDVAIMHCDAIGATQVTDSAGASWVARSHKIEYLSPAYAGDEVTALSWVVRFRGVRSLRRYSFLRESDKKLLAQGETDWIFVDAKSGRPRKISNELMRLFPIATENDEPT